MITCQRCRDLDAAPAVTSDGYVAARDVPVERTMRPSTPLVLTLLLLASGCSLYLGGGGNDDSSDDTTPGDDGPTTSSCDFGLAECEDGVVTLGEWPGESCPELSPPRVVARCPGDCTTDYQGQCFEFDCAGPDELCVDPPAEPLPARLACAAPPTGSCIPGSTFACTRNAIVGVCNNELDVGTCRCNASGTWSCVNACADGLCGAVAVQRALTGTWTGTVTSEWGTYSGTLTFERDGHYYATRPGPESVFYYGVDGGGDARRFHVLGQTRNGATALVRIFFGFQSIQDGMVREIRIQGDQMSFDFIDAWGDCTRVFHFELTRVVTATDGAR